MQNLITALSNSLIVYFYIFITFIMDLLENWFNNDYMILNTDKLKFIANDIMDISWYLFAFYISLRSLGGFLIHLKINFKISFLYLRIFIIRLYFLFKYSIYV